MKVVVIVLLGAITLILLAYLGLQIRPAPFPSLREPSGHRDTVPLPAGLPAPVERFFQTLYGDTVPVITSAVISGRAALRIRGVRLLARFRFFHEAGHAYRHVIEVTWFGLTLMRVNETYLDGRSRLELPFGVTENEPKVDQAANLGLWSEAIWFPALYLTDPRVRWEPIDDVTAVLVAPFGADEERFIVRFDPDSGLVSLFESMRYKGAESQGKTLWLNQARGWGEVGGHLIPHRAALIWLDEGTPWAVFTVEEVVHNLEVGAYLRTPGK